MHPEVVAFLEETARDKSIRVLVVTTGLATIWEKVLEREMLATRIKVIGSGPIRGGCVVTPWAKRNTVLALKRTWGLKAWVFGSSPSDIPMLREANYPVVVVGSEETRSSIMDKELSEVIKDGLQARQVLLPSPVSPLLDTNVLPVVQLKDLGFAESASPRYDTAEIPVALPKNLGPAESAPSRPETAEPAQLSDQEVTEPISRQLGEPDVVHATDKAASRLLMTPTWDAGVSGPSLREAHHQVGRYLATKFVAEPIGTESYSIPQVDEDQTMGFRLKDEAKTLIVALTGAGEPMALGVSSAFPTAMFICAKDPFDLAAARINQASSILLVDGMVNVGEKMLDAIRHIRAVSPEVRVVVVARVVQERCVGRKGGNELSCMIRDDENLGVVALRVSEDRNMEEQKIMDMGNRLFNVTPLP
ncbi:haloacid dehalogenase-like hydrolase [Candidatus Bathyarchaeota archaeon]|nr:haloacid dehalogenase-like hydrolase [Candidatus Bathyarchaeota archaeon]